MTIAATTPPRARPQMPHQPYFYRHNIEQPVYRTRAIPPCATHPHTPPAFTAWSDLSLSAASTSRGRHRPRMLRQPRPDHPARSAFLSIARAGLTQCTHDRVNSDGHGPTTETTLKGEHRSLRALARQNPRTTTSPAEPHSARNRKLFAFASRQNLISASAPSSSKPSISDTTITEGFRPVGYGTLPRTNYYTPATLRVVPVDLKLPTQQAPHRLPPRHRRRRPRRPRLHRPHAHHPQGLRPHARKTQSLRHRHPRRPHLQRPPRPPRRAHPGPPRLRPQRRQRRRPVPDRRVHRRRRALPPHRTTTSASSTRPPPSNSSIRARHSSPPPTTSQPAEFNNWIEERGHGFLDTWAPALHCPHRNPRSRAPAEHIPTKARRPHHRSARPRPLDLLSPSPSTASSPKPSPAPSASSSTC